MIDNELYEKFKNDIEIVIDTLFQDEQLKYLFNKNRSRFWEGKEGGQYANAIYWYKLMLSDEAKTSLNPGYKDITGIHIMPYRITENDVNIAIRDNQKILTMEGTTNSFNIISIYNPDFVNFDKTSANFHKVPDGNYQVVLVIGSGPRWKNGEFDENIEKLEQVKTDFYFPGICSENEKDITDSDGILMYIKKVLHVIGLEVSL